MLHLDPIKNNFTQEEYQKYVKHLILSPLGISGQKKLNKAKILCVGVGGLGSACLLHLAAAGINTIGIIDNDKVELSNLQRQIIYKNHDIGKEKIECARRNLLSLNPNCKIQLYHDFLNTSNLESIVPSYDVVIDGTDNFKSKKVISDACELFNKPHVYGAIAEFEGQLSVFNYQGGPKYKDLYRLAKQLNTLPTCDRRGVLCVLPGIIGSLQAVEVIKMIIGVKKVLTGRMLVYNALTTSFKKVQVRKTFSYQSTSLSKSYGSYQRTINANQDFIYPPITNSTLLIDVRKQSEYTIGHIKEAVNIPMRKLTHKNTLFFLQQESLTKTIYIYCNTQTTSITAIALLAKYGIISYIYRPFVST